MTAVYLQHVLILHLGLIPVPVMKDILEMEKRAKVRKPKKGLPFSCLRLRLINVCVLIYIF